MVLLHSLASLAALLSSFCTLTTAQITSRDHPSRFRDLSGAEPAGCHDLPFCKDLDAHFPSPDRLSSDVDQSPVKWAVKGKRSTEAQYTLPSPSPLSCFQVQSPVNLPNGAITGGRKVGPPATNQKCKNGEVLLMNHVFGNSYGHPFVGQYKPPTDCEFNSVVISLKVKSAGTQFDRLATVWLGDTEVWRTSTAEPRKSPGIEWTFDKDVTNYLTLWKQPQKLIFDLGNLVNNKYTASYNATLTATFYTHVLRNSIADPASLILPISSGISSQGQPSTFVFPDEDARSSHSFPSDTKRAVVSISATGQIDEEFWWGNVPESLKYIFNSTAGPLPGLSSFREVQLLIDGKLAGAAWPFPVIFTGGIAPSLHRPMVGLQAFDLRESEIDISPFLGILGDGKKHDFRLQVMGIDDTGKEAVLKKVPATWILSAKIFLWIGPDEGALPLGALPQVSVSPLYYHLSANTAKAKATGSLDYAQDVRRIINITAVNPRHDGPNTDHGWQQTFQMLNSGVIGKEGKYQFVNASYGGTDTATFNSANVYQSRYLYPLVTKQSYKIPDGKYNLSLSATLSQGMHISTYGQSAFSNGLEPYLASFDDVQRTVSLVNANRNGQAFYYQLPGSSGGFGTVSENYSLTAQANNETVLYSRVVKEVNETIVEDHEFSKGGSATVSNNAKFALGNYAPARGKPAKRIS